MASPPPEREAPFSDDPLLAAPHVLAGFDAEGYADLYPDVRSYGDGLAHWLRHGRFEGRLAPGLSPYALRSRDPAAVARRAPGVTLFGPLSSPTGLGTAARGFVRALETAGEPFRAVPIDLARLRAGRADLPPVPPPGWDAHRVNLLVNTAETIEGLCSAYGRRLLDDAWNIGHWVWELPGFRSDWAACFGAVDEVWVASEFCRRAVAACSPVPVHTVPYVVEVDGAGAALGRAHFGLPEDVFVFAHVFDASSLIERKNPRALVRAFKAAFGDDPSVLLVLKYHSARGQRAPLSALYRESWGSNIRLVADVFGEEENAAFKRSVDCLVSPHRSEGFGFNIAEMMALAKPVIATGYAAPLDFMTPDNAYAIDHRLVPVGRETGGRDIGPYPADCVWADPDVGHMAHLMRHVRDNREEARAKGQRAAQDIRRLYSADAVAARIRSRLDALGVHADPPGFLDGWGRSAGRRFVHPLSRIADPELRDRVRGWPARPVFSVLLVAGEGGEEELVRSVDSLFAQDYPLWELCLCLPGGESGAADGCGDGLPDGWRLRDERVRVLRGRTADPGLCAGEAAELSSGGYLIPLRAGDRLHPAALRRFAERIVAESQPPDLIYADEEGPGGRKPDWSPEHLESTMYLGGFLAVRKAAFLEAGGFRPGQGGAGLYDLALRLSRSTGRILSLRAVAGQRVAGQSRPPAGDAAAQRRALEEHVGAKYGNWGRVEPGRRPGCFRVRVRPPGTPPVTLVIPATGRQADIPGRGRVSLLDSLLVAILKTTAYPAFRILVAETGCLSDRQRQAYAANRIGILGLRAADSSLRIPPAAVLNAALRASTTELVVLLDEGMEVTEAGWLAGLVEPVRNPEIGLAGPDGLVAGPEGLAPVPDPDLLRGCAAPAGMTAALRRSLVEEAGGFDERLETGRAVTDLGLAALALGYRNLSLPADGLVRLAPPAEAPPGAAARDEALLRHKWAGLFAASVAA